MRNARAALWGAVCSLFAMMLGALLYGLSGRSPMTAEDAILLPLVALSGWVLYLGPGLALGIGARLALRHWGILTGTLLATVLAALCGAGVGYLFSVGAPHVSATRAAASLAAAWGLTALLVLALVSRRIADRRPTAPA